MIKIKKPKLKESRYPQILKKMLLNKTNQKLLKKIFSNQMNHKTNNKKIKMK
jgi:hypothetical protein